MKRIVFVLLMTAFVVHFSKAQSLPSHSDSVLFVASTFLNGEFLMEGKVFCEKNSNGIEKYQASGFKDLSGGNTIMYHFVPGVTSMAMRFEIADSLNIQYIRYSIKEGSDSIRVANQQFLDAKHVDKFHVVSIHGIECREKSVLVELYDVRNPQLLIRIMIGTETVVPMPAIVWFSYGKDGGYKKLATEKFSYEEKVQLVGFLKTRIPLQAYSMELKRPGLMFWQNSAVFEFSVNEYFDLIDTTETNDSLTKIFYANGYRYRMKGLAGFVGVPGTYNITIKSIAAAVKRGKIEYKTDVMLSTFKLRRTSRQILALFFFYGVLLLIMFAIVYFPIRRRNKRQQKKLQQQNEISQLKLQSIRSQLNPHFVFNALAGIQNLMNKNETEKANNYLAAFSRITRSVLDNSAKELITVDEEIKLLTDYLQMEQLRFGFKYNIDVAEELDKHNIEIPAMLLQPFVENAVKHGISSLKENGSINVSFAKINNDLQLSVTDNGKGFDMGKDYNGLGLQLSKSRIALLNTVYKTTPAQLNIESNAQGTKVNITLKNWL